MKYLFIILLTGSCSSYNPVDWISGEDDAEKDQALADEEDKESSSGDNVEEAIKPSKAADSQSSMENKLLNDPVLNDAIAKTPKDNQLTDYDEARLWTRMDELEREIFEIKELLYVIEKSLNLGLKPSQIHAQNGKAFQSMDLENTLRGRRYQTSQQESARTSQKISIPSGGNEEMASPTGDPEMASKTTPEQSNKFKLDFEKAHQFYLAGKYGQAIVIFANLQEQYGTTYSGGLHVFWVGKCWLGMKEYNTARKRFLEFVNNNSGSPYVARAKVELAKAEYFAGLRKTAIDRLKKVIEDYPYEDASEMARYELARLKDDI